MIRVLNWLRSLDRSTHMVETSPGVWVTTGPGEEFTVSVSELASVREGDDLAPPTNYVSTLRKVEADEAKWLKALAIETEATGSPWAAAVNVFGASPPDAVPVSL